MSAHILAIDAGNTRIKWGVHDGRDGHEWSLRGAVDVTDFAGSYAFRDVLATAAIDQIVASNVAGPSVATAIEDQTQSLGKPISFVSARAQQCGVVNGYDNPAQLGSDRWAALIGAHAAARDAPRAQLVVMAGTALTVDALSADGHFLGGIIAPGMMLMHRALNRGTAQLPAAIGQYQTFPTNTVNAITAGAIEACAGAVQRMATHLAAQVGDMPRCIGSGGAMHVLAQHLPFPVSINDNLVLDGLLAIANSGRNPR